MSEAASVWYLLCPHHCLVRLRAVCAFWSFVRRSEREVVLEGKKPWVEDMAADSTPSPTENRHDEHAARMMSTVPETNGIGATKSSKEIVLGSDEVGPSRNQTTNEAWPETSNGIKDAFPAPLLEDSQGVANKSIPLADTPVTEPAAIADEPGDVKSDLLDDTQPKADRHTSRACV